MKELLQLYVGICIVALVLKYGMKAVIKLMGKSISDKHNHEDEHAQGHLIKLLILLLLALLLFFVLKRNSYETPSSVSLNDTEGRKGLYMLTQVTFSNAACLLLNGELNVQGCNATKML